MPAQVKTAKPRKERVENAAKRRAQIIEATIDSINLHGLSGTTLATVAAQAGLSQGSAVFYFQTKEKLLVETFRTHYEDYRKSWIKVFETPYDDPVAHVVDFVNVDLSEKICSRRNLTLWYAFWGETQARPRFGEIAQEHDAERQRHLARLAKAAEAKMQAGAWTATTFAQAADALTDGLWMALHMSSERSARRKAREVLAQFLASVFPSHRDMICGVKARRR